MPAYVLYNGHYVPQDQDGAPDLTEDLRSYAHPDEDADPDDPTQVAKINRRPLTEEEANSLLALEGSLGQLSSRFCCGGSVRIGVRKPMLFYSDNEVDQNGAFVARALDLNSETDDDYGRFHEAARRSSHGVGRKKVYDDAYRLSKELKAGKFALNFDPLDAENGIIDAVAAVCGVGVRVALYKVNTYGPNGFFNIHKDTPKSEAHIGTIVVALPAPFEGGNLAVTNQDKEVTFDWSRSSGHSAFGKLNWSFFFSDVYHKIAPVTSGHRITLAYDVYRRGDGRMSSNILSSLSPIDAETTPLMHDVSALLANPGFLKKGGRVAFSLQHGYPLGQDAWKESYCTFFKGSDRVLFDVLAALSLDPTLTLTALYEVDLGLTCGTPPDNFTPWFNTSPDCSGWDKVLLTGPEFAGMESNELGEVAQLSEVAGAAIDRDLIWCSRPRRDTFTEMSSYIAYGNEPCTEYSYAAAALIAHIPSFKKRAKGRQAGSDAGVGELSTRPAKRGRKQ